MLSEEEVLLSGTKELDEVLPGKTELDEELSEEDEIGPRRPERRSFDVPLVGASLDVLVVEGGASVSKESSKPRFVELE